MMEWQPIETAPKDGRIIWVADPDCGAFMMKWNAVGYNDTFAPYDIGIWETPDGGMTWSEGRNCGPTKWQDIGGKPNGWELPLLNASE